MVEVVLEVHGRDVVERLLEFMRERCPEAVLEEVEPPSVTFTVPTDASALSRLFAQLAEAQAGLHVSECSVTQCTLEQIFILMASKSKCAAGPPCARPCPRTRNAVLDRQPSRWARLPHPRPLPRRRQPAQGVDERWRQRRAAALSGGWAQLEGEKAPSNGGSRLRWPTAPHNAGGPAVYVC